MKKVIRIGRKRKSKLTVNEKYLTRDLHTKIEMIQALIPIGMMAVAEQLEEEVIRLAGQSPKAMVIRDINSLTGIGAVVLRVPTVTDLDQDPTRVIATGDWVRIDGDNGIVEVIKPSPE